MSEGTKMSRRQFMKTSALAGGGLLLACHLPFGSRAALAAGDSSFAPNAFLRIGMDDSITIIVNKSEMGQGVYTSLPMLVPLAAAPQPAELPDRRRRRGE